MRVQEFASKKDMVSPKKLFIDYFHCNKFVTNMFIGMGFFTIFRSKEVE